MRELLAALPAPAPVAGRGGAAHRARLRDAASPTGSPARSGSTCGVAIDGELPGPGAVRVAPGGAHLRLDRRRPPRARRRRPRRGAGTVRRSTSSSSRSPRSVRATTAAVLLTGMGSGRRRGARRAARAPAAYCLVQDEASSAVCGMPRAALEAGAAEAALAPRELGAGARPPRWRGGRERAAGRARGAGAARDRQRSAGGTARDPARGGANGALAPAVAPTSRATSTRSPVARCAASGSCWRRW